MASENLKLSANFYYLGEVFGELSIFGLVFFGYLTCQLLRVTSCPKIFFSHLLCLIHSCNDGFIFCMIVASLEFESKGLLSE